MSKPASLTLVERTGTAILFRLRSEPYYNDCALVLVLGSGTWFWTILPMPSVTRILNAIEPGDATASEELLPLVYEDLRRLAAQKLLREKPGQTLQATALVHEAYIRLVGSEDPKWDSRGHFFAAAAEAMRRILIENARRKKQIKHGGGRRVSDLDKIDLPVDLPVEGPADDLLAMDEALTKLAVEDPVKADLVKLRYFAGLTCEQATESLGISRVTAHRYWTYARAWLHHEITKDDDRPQP